MTHGVNQVAVPLHTGVVATRFILPWLEDTGATTARIKPTRQGHCDRAAPLQSFGALGEASPHVQLRRAGKDESPFGCGRTGLDSCNGSAALPGAARRSVLRPRHWKVPS